MDNRAFSEYTAGPEDPPAATCPRLHLPASPRGAPFSIKDAAGHNRAVEFVTAAQE